MDFPFSGTHVSLHFAWLSIPHFDLTRTATKRSGVGVWPGRASPPGRSGLLTPWRSLQILWQGILCLDMERQCEQWLICQQYVVTVSTPCEFVDKAKWTRLFSDWSCFGGLVELSFLQLVFSPQRSPWATGAFHSWSSQVYHYPNITSMPTTASVLSIFQIYNLVV
jgi:hypothetical protein